MAILVTIAPTDAQFMMNLMCWGDGDIPAFIELADGNQADKTRFAQLMQEFKQQWDFEGVYVADSALYSQENLQRLSGLQWLTRVPLTLNAASELVHRLTIEWHESDSGIIALFLNGAIALS